MDHMRRGTLRLDKLKDGHPRRGRRDVEHGFPRRHRNHPPVGAQERQTVFFSATMPKPIRDLIEKYSREPQNVRIEQKAMTVPTVEQTYFEVTGASKSNC